MEECNTYTHFQGEKNETADAESDSEPLDNKRFPEINQKFL